MLDKIILPDGREGFQANSGDIFTIYGRIKPLT
jgi:hypothetical protein